jgi:transposase-like protein
MGRRGYPPEFRRKVLDLLESGRKLDDVARDLQISPETIYEWRRQDLIDRGLQRGLTAREKAELRRRQEADRRVDVLGQEVDDTGSLT